MVVHVLLQVFCFQDTNWADSHDKKIIKNTFFFTFFTKGNLHKKKPEKVWFLGAKAPLGLAHVKIIIIIVIKK